MIKNTSGQSIGAQMITASDGSAFTGTVTVYVTGDNGTQAIGSVGSGVCTHEGNGYHSYAPSQGETNYDHVAYTFIGTGAIASTIQVFTKAGDAFTRLGAPAGASIAADIATVDGNVDSIKTVTDNLPNSGSLTDLASQSSVDTIDGIVDTILVDTAEIGAAGAGLTALASQSSVDAIDTVVDAILLDTAEIGAAGAGLTALATQASVDTIDGNVDAIKLKTDDLTFTVSGVVDSNLTHVNGGSTAASTFDRFMRTFTSGDVSAGSTTTMVDTALTQADDYWNGMIVTFRSGANTGLGRIISDWDQGTNTMTFSEAFPAAIGNGDDYVIVPYHLFDWNNDAVANVTLVATTTTNTDMRGTDGANTTAPDNSSITSIKAVTDKMDDTLEDDSGTYRFTTNALEQAPSGGGGSAPTVEEIRAEMDSNSTQLAAIVADTGTDIPSSISGLDGKIDIITDALIAREGTSTATSGNTITLDAGATTNENFYRGQLIAITSGSGKGQVRIITQYSTGRVATITPSWDTTPDATSGYALLNSGLANVVAWRDSQPLSLINNSVPANVRAWEDSGTVPSFALEATVNALNNFDPATDVVANVTLVDTVTTNTDMRGTDNALLASSYTAPNNASIAAILADTDELQQNQGDWATATGFSTFDPDNDTVARVTLVDTTTANTDMRGTDGANTVAPDNAGITANGTAIGNLNDISVDDIFNKVIENSLTFLQTQRLQNSAMLGKLSGGATTTNTFRDLADSKNRIVATVDSSGNRTALTLDGD